MTKIDPPINMSTYLATYLPNVYFLWKCIFFVKVYFLNVYFQNCIFRKCVFRKFLAQLSVGEELIEPNLVCQKAYPASRELVLFVYSFVFDIIFPCIFICICCLLYFHFFISLRNFAKGRSGPQVILQQKVWQTVGGQQWSQWPACIVLPSPAEEIIHWNNKALPTTDSNKQIHKQTNK